MRKLTKETLKQFIDQAKEIPTDVFPGDTELGKRGLDMLEEFRLSKLGEQKHFDVDSSYDWHGLLVLNDRDGKEYGMSVSFALPIIVPDFDIEIETERVRLTVSRLAPETVEIVDKIAEKYGYFILDRSELDRLARELGYTEVDIKNVAGLYDQD